MKHDAPANGDRFPRIARAASALAIVLGLAALLGWILDVPVLRSIVPGLVGMKVNTAVALISVAISLQLQIEPSIAGWQMRVARACALLTCAMGALTLLEYQSGMSLGIDQVLLRAAAGEPATSHPGRMAPNTAFCLVLLGIAGFVVDHRDRARRVTTQSLAVIVLLVTLISSAGYAFNIAALYRVKGFTAMAVPTVACLVALSLAILAARPRATALRFLDWPLRAKMAALLIVASVVPLGIAGLVDTQAAAKQLEATTRALLAARGDQLVMELDGYNRHEQRSVDDLARAVATLGCCDDLDAVRLRAVRALLATRLVSESKVHGAAILDLRGRVRFATDARLEGRDLSYHSYVREALRGVPVVSDVHVAGAEGADQPTVAYLAPVRSLDGMTGGLAVIWTHATGLWDLMKMSNELAGAGSFAVMFDHQGIRIAHSSHADSVFHPGGPLSRETIEAAVSERRFGDRTVALLTGVREFPEQFERARADSPDLASFRGFAPGNEQWNYCVGRRLETVPWTVFYLVPEAVLQGQIALSTRSRAAFASTVTVFAVLVGALFAFVILAPIRSLSGVTERLARGQLGARVEILRDDELGKLGLSFNRMADRLELQATELRQSNDDLEERVRRRTIQLAASEAKYRELYESLPDMCVTVDVESEAIIECNETLAKQLGYSKGELLGRRVSDLYDADVFAPRPSERLEFEKSGELRDRERVLKRKDGTRLDVSLSVVAVEVPGGRHQAKAVWRDITARKQAERDRQFVAELGELQRLSSGALDLMATIAERLALHLRVPRAAFVEIDADQGRITIRRDFHGELPSVAGTFELSAHSTETAAEQRAGNTVVVQDTMTDPRTASSFEAAYGKIGTRSTVSVPLIRDGQWVASLAVSDIRARAWQEREVALVQSVAERGWLWIEYLRLAAALREKEAQALVQRNEERFRLLVDGVKEYAILLLDSTGHVASWNGGAARLKGYEAAEIVGKHISVFFTPEDIALGHPEEMLRRAAAEGRWEEEVWRVRKDGSRFLANVLLSPLRDVAGVLEGFAEVTRDHTDRRRTEEVLHQRQAQLTASVRERDVLLQEVHHRVKNNLQVISSLINMQRRQLIDKSSQRALDECRMRVDTIALIHEKLYQSGDYANVSFSDYVKSLAANIFKATGLPSSGVKLEMNVEAISLGVDKAIPCALVLNECITNALKHAFPAARGGTIRVDLRKVDGQVMLAVTDDGVGIQADLDHTNTKSLGMQLIVGLVEQLRGRLEIVQDGGTSCRVTFPPESTA
ncbi:MAG: PAS domain S-box protein [Polyangiaceae bacterium]